MDSGAQRDQRSQRGQLAVKSPLGTELALERRGVEPVGQERDRRGEHERPPEIERRHRRVLRQEDDRGAQHRLLLLAAAQLHAHRIDAALALQDRRGQREAHVVQDAAVGWKGARLQEGVAVDGGSDVGS